MKIEKMKKGLDKLRYIMVADEERFTRSEKLIRHSIEVLIGGIMLYFVVVRFFSPFIRLVILALMLLFGTIFLPYYRAGIKKRQKEERMEEQLGI